VVNTVQEEKSMFWFKHPRPLLSTRADAVQMVARKAQAAPEVRLIIVEKPAPVPNPEPEPAIQPVTDT
jgi:hypothetical protein